MNVMLHLQNKKKCLIVIRISKFRVIVILFIYKSKKHVNKVKHCYLLKIMNCKLIKKVNKQKCSKVLIKKIMYRLL